MEWDIVGRQKTQIQVLQNKLALVNTLYLQMVNILGNLQQVVKKFKLGKKEMAMQKLLHIH